MFRSVTKFGSIAAVVFLTACVANTTSVTQQPDGSVTITDSQPASGRLAQFRTYFRDEGRTVARICAQYDGNPQAVGQRLVAAGYVSVRDTFATLWGKRSGFNLVATPRMSQSDPCKVSLPGSGGEEFFQGAEAALREMGYQPIGSQQWSNGSSTLIFKGRVSSSGSMSSATVEIRRN